MESDLKHLINCSLKCCSNTKNFITSNNSEVTIPFCKPIASGGEKRFYSDYYKMMLIWCLIQKKVSNFDYNKCTSKNIYDVMSSCELFYEKFICTIYCVVGIYDQMDGIWKKCIVSNQVNQHAEMIWSQIKKKYVDCYTISQYVMVLQESVNGGCK